MPMRLHRLPGPIRPWAFWLWGPAPGPRFRNGAHTLCLTLGRWLISLTR